MTFRCLLAIFLVAPLFLDNWLIAQESAGTASPIQIFDNRKEGVQEVTINGAFDIGDLARDESFVSTSSYTRKAQSASELDAKYAAAQQNVINDSIRIAGVSLAVVFAVIVGGLWLYNNSTGSFGERRSDSLRRRSSRRRF